MTTSPSFLEKQQEQLLNKDYDVRISNLAAFIHHKINKIPGKILDIGVGNALLIKYFNNQGYKTSGIELSQRLINDYKKQKALRGINFKKGDITKLQGDAEYDYVLCCDVLEHIKDDKKAIKNLWSFVKIGGVLIISVPAHPHLFGERDKMLGHHRRYNKQQLINLTSNLNSYKISMLTYWNIFGYFPYYFFEKILHKKINDNFRYKKGLINKITVTIIDLLFKLEAKLPKIPIGLSLVIVIKKIK